MCLLRVPTSLPVKPTAVQSRVRVTAGCDWSGEEEIETGSLNATQDRVGASEDDGMNADVDVRKLYVN